MGGDHEERGPLGSDALGARAGGAEHPPERRESLWLLTLPLGIWALHFGLCYATASIWCAKAADASASLHGVRVAVLAYTTVALGGIAVLGRIGFARHSYGDSLAPHDDDSPEDRHRFLGLATVLLAGLAAVATTYTAMTALFFESCR